MPRSISLQTLKDQQLAADKAIEKAKEASYAARKAIKAKVARQERVLALKIGYLAIICGLGPVPDGDLESFFKTFVHPDE